MGEERVRRGSGKEETDEWNVEDDDEKKEMNVMTKALGGS